jgi:uncharacterized phage protein (TIGR01671 family)
MNDRFKFRAWIDKYNKLVDVFRYGNDLGTCEWIWHSHIYDTPDGKPVLDNWGSVDERFSNIIERTKLIDCILEQCTGLKDKNGQLIYENDLIKIDDDVAVINWSDYYARFMLESSEDIFDFERSYAEECEVIGNIYTENINDM